MLWKVSELIWKFLPHLLRTGQGYQHSPIYSSKQAWESGGILVFWTFIGSAILMRATIHCWLAKTELKQYYLLLVVFDLVVQEKMARVREGMDFNKFSELFYFVRHKIIPDNTRVRCLTSAFSCFPSSGKQNVFQLSVSEPCEIKPNRIVRHSN